ncbi:PKD domain-containing protein, partial [Candidatus Gracilibacteria bacterium]|nr:PKD domain-containing protein [Candidatus Gracilibacteria bacterium]
KKVSVVEPSKTPTSLISSTPAAVGGKITGAAPLTVDFDGTKSLDPDNNIVEYAWDFNGDNAPDKFGPQASYTFEQKGTYTVALKITDADNNERTAQVTVEATPPGIQAKINATPVSGVVPLTVKFDASASTYLDGQIISYEWDFGDGSPKRQDAAKISYKYNKVGIYTAKVTAIGSDGKKAVNSLTVTVQNIPVKACFTTNKTEANAPAEIVFNANCSTGTIAKYNWDIDGNGLFNDGSGPQVSNTFKDPGTYNISLEVTDTQGVVDSFTDAIIIK